MMAGQNALHNLPRTLAAIPAAAAASSRRRSVAVPVPYNEVSHREELTVFVTQRLTDGAVSLAVLNGC
jgi:hypothetical protein